MRVLLGVSTSIAAHRALDLASNLRKRGVQVRAVLSEGVPNLISAAAFDAITQTRTITNLWGGGHEGEMDHLAATKWAEHFVFAPASANLLAKLAHGIADDAIGTFALAFNKRPFIIAPAMNPEMWRNAAVRENVETLRRRGHRFVGPVAGETACGDFGLGRLAPVDAIEQALMEQVEGWDSLPDLRGERIVISGGPTREFADDVRFISNPSTGKMAWAIAREAADGGAHVTLVAGPVDLAPPTGLAKFIRVETAEQMRDAMLAELPRATMAVFAAAVSDWRPAERLHGKLKKREGETEMTVRFVRTPDIAMEASRSRRAGQIFLGFAAESDGLTQNAEEKLRRKGFDLVFANPINEPGAGFASETNRGLFLWANGRREPVENQGKRRIARRILTEGLHLRLLQSPKPAVNGLAGYDDSTARLK